jgi:hypothetical protein
VVVSVSVEETVPAPGVRVCGLKDAVVNGGSPEADNVTVPGKFPPVPDALIVYIAACPAVMVFEPEAFAIEKSVIVKVSAFDVPPTGAGLTTVTDPVPEEAMSAAVIAAVTCPEFTNVVVRALPFHCAVEFVTKFVPLIVSVKAAPPAVPEDGASEVSVGKGLFTAKLTEFDGPPAGAGFVTTTAGVPPIATSVARIAMVT